MFCYLHFVFISYVIESCIMYIHTDQQWSQFSFLACLSLLFLLQRLARPPPFGLWAVFHEAALKEPQALVQGPI